MDNIMQYYKDLAQAGKLDWKSFLEFSSNVYSYSFNAQLEIYNANPTATAVATLAQWNTLNNRIRFGQKAIRIHNKNSVEHQNVFDISQTQYPERIKKWQYNSNADGVFYSITDNTLKNTKAIRTAEIWANLYEMAYGFISADKVPQNVRAFIADSAVYSAMIRMGLDTNEINPDFSNAQQILADNFEVVGNYHSALLHFFCNSAQGAVKRYNQIKEKIISENKEITISRPEGSVNYQRIDATEETLTQIAMLIPELKVSPPLASGDMYITILDYQYDRCIDRLSDLGYKIIIDNEPAIVAEEAEEDTIVEIADLTASGTTDETITADEDNVIEVEQFENDVTDAEVIPEVDISVINDFKAKTDRYLNTAPFFNMSAEDIENTVKGDIERIFSENGVNAVVDRIAIYGARSRALNSATSDLDVVVEIRSDLKEDALFNIIHSEPMSIGGVTVDVNPIKAEQTGTLDTYLQSAEEYLLEKARDSEGADRGFLNAHRVGDFYELYGKDALAASYTLGLYLTRKQGRDMVGFPAHNRDYYAELFKKAGYELNTLNSVVVDLSPNTPQVEKPIVKSNVPTIKNLNQLKKQIEAGMIFEITEHIRPECIGERRIVTSVNTVEFTSRKLNENAEPYGKDIHMEFGKAGDWKIEGNELTSYLQADEVLMSFHFLDSVEPVKEQTSEVEESVSQDTPLTESGEPSKIYQLITDGHEDGGIDDKEEFSSLDDAIVAGKEYLSQGYEGVCVTNTDTKHIEHTEGDFRLKAAFSSAYLRNDGYTELADELERENTEDGISADEEKASEQFSKLSDRFDANYDMLYDAHDDVPAYDTAIAIGDEYIRNDPDFINQFNEIRGDIISSDRETAAFAFALVDVGLISNFVTEEQQRIHDENKAIIDNLKENDIITLPDGVWRIERISGDFSISLENMDKDNIMSNRSHIGRWKEKILEDAKGTLIEVDKAESVPKFEIYQLKYNEETKDIHYVSFDTMSESGKSPDISTYDKVYEGDFAEFEQAGDTVKQQLEAIFKKFNSERPNDFKGHSLSVSDVVVINGNAHYVDTFGFRELPNFLEKEQSKENNNEVESAAPEARASEQSKQSVSTIKVNDVNAKRNYRSFVELFPCFMNKTYSYMRFTAGDNSGIEPLSLEWLSDNTFSMMNTYVQNGDLMRDPEIVYQVDFDNQSVYPISYENSGLAIYNEYDASSAQSADANSFTRTWLNENIKHFNYKAERTIEIGRNGREDTEKSYEDMAHFYERYDLHFGLSGNGITVYDILHYDNQINDYPTVAHISEEGKITYYPDFHPDEVNASYISQIEQAAQAKREDYRQEWEKLDILKRYETILDRANITQQTEIMSRRDSAKLSVEKTVAKYENSVIFGTEPFPNEYDYMSAKDLLDAVLADRIGNMVGTADRIYSFYSTSPAKADLAKFIAKEYGIGGGSIDFGGYWFEDYNTSGLVIQHRNRKDDKQYTWSQVADGIISRIERGVYYKTPEAIENSKEYDKAVNLINTFLLSNGGDSHYYDYSRIELARVEYTDGRLPLIAYADLVTNRIFKEYNGTYLSETSYSDLSDMIDNGLSSLDMGELTSLSDNEKQSALAGTAINAAELAVGDKVLFNGREHTITKLSGMLPNDIQITEYRDGEEYVSHIDRDYLAEKATYIEKADGNITDEQLAQVTTICIPEYNIAVDLRNVNELVISNVYDSYEGGIDSDGHERKDNYSQQQTNIVIDFSDYDRVQGGVVDGVKRVNAYLEDSTNLWSPTEYFAYSGIADLENNVKKFIDDAAQFQGVLSVYTTDEDGNRTYINTDYKEVDNTKPAEDVIDYENVRYKVEPANDTAYPYNVKLLVKLDNTDNYYYATSKLVKTREQAQEYIDNDIKVRSSNQPAPNIKQGDYINIGGRSVCVDAIDEVAKTVLLRYDEQSAFPILTEHSFGTINAIINFNGVKGSYEKLLIDEREALKEPAKDEPKDVTIEISGDDESLDNVKDYALSLGAVVIKDNPNNKLSVSTYENHIDEIFARADELGIEHNVITSDLPVISTDIMEQALRNDSQFRIKLPQIGDFFAENADTADRENYVKTIFEQAVYTQNYLEGSTTDYLGYIADETGLTIWEGNYLSRTAESRLSWAEVAYQYGELHRNGRLITAAAEIEQLTEQAEQSAEVITDIQIGDRFRNRISGEISEVISLEGALPYYTGQCTVTRTSGRFEVTENKNNSDLLNADIYERLEREQPAQEQSVVNTASNYVITDNELGVSTPSQRLENNMNAIRTLKRLEQNGQQATPEEQEIISRYTGWGALQDIFDTNSDRYSEQRAELKSLLTEEEYEKANESVLSAFYTQPIVIKAMYNALEEMGFKGGKVLEPSMAVGNFFGCMPESLSSKCELSGVEIESLSSGIAKQLYPNADIQNTGYEDTRFNDNTFDVAVGNVPFGNIKVFDTRYNGHNFLIHDYFFAKTIDKVRPNGVVAFITSHGTMDKKSSKVREYISERAKFLGAIRLPNNAFKANAGTDVVSDIIFLQKRPTIVAEHERWCYTDYNADGIAINSYYLENPNMVCGELSTRSGRYGDEIDVKPYTHITLEQALQNCIHHLPKNIDMSYESVITVDDNEKKGKSDNFEYVDADPRIAVGTFGCINGEIYFRCDKQTMEHKTKLSAKKKSNYIKFIRLANATRNIINVQTRSEDNDEEFEQARAELNAAFDDFAAADLVFEERYKYEEEWTRDVSYSLCTSLMEKVDGKMIKTSGLFKGRTLRHKITVEHCDTIEDAFLLSLNNLNRIDFRYISRLTDRTNEEIIDTLNGTYMFLDPLHADKNNITVGWVTSDEYLSGNVREKLRIAETYAKEDEKYNINKESLEKVIPEWITYDDISVQLGTAWLPEWIIEDFIKDTFDMPRSYGFSNQVEHELTSGTWRIANKAIGNNYVKSRVTFGTERMNGLHILERTLNLSDAKIYDRVEDEDGNMKSVLNKEETRKACAKQDVLKEEFENWIYQDEKRISTIEEVYNKRFNSERLRTFDGSNLSFDGMNTTIELEKHQKDAVARILYSGNTLIAHVVGAGKTYELAAASMELKRTGTANKSLFVVPNHLVGQWGKEFLTLYPAANILLADPKSLSPQKRKEFLAKIVHNDYDAIIMAYSTFSQISVSAERRRKFYKDEIDNVIESLDFAERNSLTQKALQSRKKQLEMQLKSLEYVKDREDMITFEQLGIDYMFVDEAHNFKNLGMNTKLGTIAGISTSASKRSEDMLMKIKYINEINGSERGICFATGTPISNSIVEMYTMQRYLQPSYLAEKGVQHFDSWVGNFGKIQTTIELSPTGTSYRAKKRCASFNNLPELQQMFRRCTDVKTAEMLKLPIPKLKENKYSIYVSTPTEEQQEFIRECGDRADDVHNGAVDPSVDNMLKITNDGKMCALDYRLIDPNAEDNPDSKVNMAIENIFNKYEETADTKGTQVVFLDRSTPDPNKFNLYDDMRDKLVNMGIPKEEIAFIHDAKNDNQKLKMFDDVNKGNIRVIFGSTEKMGAGTNIQQRLCALHHIDVPWRPSDIEQREGRILRKGNTNEEVEIFRYVTKGTFDSYSWQTIENKQKFISQAMVDSVSGRTIDDVDSAALSYAEIKTLAVNDPRIKEQLELTNDVSKLKMLKGQFSKERKIYRDKVNDTLPKDIQKYKAQIENFEQAVEYAKKFPKPEGEEFSIVVDGKTYTEKAKAGEKLAALSFKVSSLSGGRLKVGEYRGFDLEMSRHIMTDGGYFFHLHHDRATVTTPMGSSYEGNIARIDNLVDIKLPEALEGAKANLEKSFKEMEIAKAELEKPFAHEDELKEKSKKLSELNAALNFDKEDKEALMLDDDENQGGGRK